MIFDRLANAWNRAMANRQIRRLRHRFGENAILREDGARKILVGSRHLTGQQQQRLLDIMLAARKIQNGDDKSFFPHYYVGLLKDASLTPDVQGRVCDVLAANENDSTPFMVSQLLSEKQDFIPVVQERLCRILAKSPTEHNAHLATNVLDSARYLEADSRKILTDMLLDVVVRPDAKYFRAAELGRLLEAEQPLPSAEQKRLTEIYGTVLRNDPFNAGDLIRELMLLLRSDKIPGMAREKIVDAMTETFSYDAPRAVAATGIILGHADEYHLTLSETQYLKLMRDHVIPIIQKATEDNAHLQDTQPLLYDFKLQTCFAPPDSPLRLISQPASDTLVNAGGLMMIIPSNNGYGPN